MTDNIIENQLENLRLCDNCPGYLVLNTEARRLRTKRGKCFVYFHSFYCLQLCRAEAENLYEQAKKTSDYHYLYLQNKPDDTFLSYNLPAARVSFRGIASPQCGFSFQ